jgi:glycerophosphoryl diester phosphodiesterase
LLNDNAAVGAADFALIAGYAQAIGVPKSLVMNEDAAGDLVPTTLMRDAHAAGLLVHVWTFRAENAFLPAQLRRGNVPAEHGDIAAEVKLHLSAGADGLFCDQPDLVEAVIEGVAHSGV